MDAYIVTERKLVFPDDNAHFKLIESGDAPGELLLLEFIREGDSKLFWSMTPAQCEQLASILADWRAVVSVEQDHD